MTKYITLLFAVAVATICNAQDTDSTYYRLNAAETLLKSNSQLTIGGYGEVNYNQPFDTGSKSAGELDVQRLVMLFGYKFTNKTQFVTEIEFEHVEEVFVEQAFVQHELGKAVNLRAGLLLTPMGIVNQYHEGPTFHGVERPKIDGVIAPTTWREIGVGVAGNLLDASSKYQLYMMNGFLGYDEGGKLKGSNGLRSGRQKAIQSTVSSPTFAGRYDYFGIRGLNLGLSGYVGNTQTTAYDDSSLTENQADSTVVGVAMLGLDYQYKRKGLQTRGQLYTTKLSDTDEYNTFTGKNLGSNLFGYYVEAAYNVLQNTDTKNNELYPFVRFSQYDTHQGVGDAIEANPGYQHDVLTTGLTWKVTRGAAFKLDAQFDKPDNADTSNKTFNAGVHIWF